MKSNQSCAIVIPIYKRELNDYERISLETIVKHFSSYDMYAAIPNGLDISEECTKKYPFLIKRFEDYFFDGFDGYNRLMTSRRFYQQFSDYEYILICQLDVLIVGDNLARFIEMGYDYIGSPIPKMHPWENRLVVGNGGFSLRKVSAFICLLQNYEDNHFLANSQNEDVFFSSCCENEEYHFHSASISNALEFAYDQPYFDLLNRMNGMKMPLGIHAWFRYDTSNSRNILKEYVPAGFVWKDDCIYSEKLREIDEFLEKNTNLYLWGAGDIGTIFLEYCIKKKVAVCGFLVSDEKRVETKTKKGVPVLHFNDVDDIFNCSVIVTISTRYRNNDNFLSILAKKGVRSRLQLSYEMILALENYLLENECLKNDISN